MTSNTHGRPTLVIDRIDGVELRFVVNDYEVKEQVLVFKDFNENDQIHIYPWHRIEHVTIIDSEE